MKAVIWVLMIAWLIALVHICAPMTLVGIAILTGLQLAFEKS